MNDLELERLMSFVDQSEDCWFWDGDRDDDYQPVFEVDGVKYHPGDILYQKLCGTFEDIESACLIPGCIRPSHKIGGARAAASKLDGEKVLHIIESNLSSKALAEIYGVSTRTICNIWKGNSWANVPGKRESSRVRARRKTRVNKPKRIKTGKSGIAFDLDTGKYIVSYYKKIGESDSLEGAIEMRNQHIKESE